MTEVPRRLILLALAATCVCILLAKGRAYPTATDSAAFSVPYGNSFVMLSGDISSAGIFNCQSSATLGSVIFMTEPDLLSRLSSKAPLLTTPVMGKHLHLTQTVGKPVEITMDNVTSTEKLALGLLLDINSMNVYDWEELPGIGPGIASAIVQNRQIYGDFRSLNDLMRVPGVGEKIFLRIHPYLCRS